MREVTEIDRRLRVNGALQIVRWHVAAMAFLDEVKVVAELKLIATRNAVRRNENEFLSQRGLVFDEVGLLGALVGLIDRDCLNEIGVNSKVKAGTLVTRQADGAVLELHGRTGRAPCKEVW